MNQPRTWQQRAQQRARQRMAEILDDICSEQEALDMLWEIYYRNGGTQVRPNRRAPDINSMGARLLDQEISKAD